MGENLLDYDMESYVQTLAVVRVLCCFFIIGVIEKVNCFFGYLLPVTIAR
jgi:hypothetical protein